MLAYLTNILTGNRPRKNPSVLLVLQRMTSTSFLHIVPETGEEERFCRSANAYTWPGTTERSREQIATVPIYSESDHFDEYLKEVATRRPRF